MGEGNRKRKASVKLMNRYKYANFKVVSYTGKEIIFLWRMNE
jgi:hypothetical protein